MLERGGRLSPRASTIELLVKALELTPADREEFVSAARLRRAVDRGPPPEPGAGIPPHPIEHFAGREAELAELHRRLQQSGRVTVYGLGGVGKSELVVRYLHDRRAEYADGVFWVRCDNEANLLSDLAALAWRLGLAERGISEQERQIEAVLRRLREHQNWLLVLDNLEPTAAEAARRWLPPGLLGHLVVTSRMPIWSARLAMEPLPLETASHFLLERTGQADSRAAVAVAEMLGCLPLALQQAAAFIEVTGRDLPSYADLLRTRLIDLMSEGKPDDYPKPVATTWQLSFERVEQDHPAAAALLRLMAFLAADDIPISVLQAGARELPDALQALADDIELDRAVAALRRYSLVERRGDTLRVHRLVQAVVRESLGVVEREVWLTGAIRLLKSALPDDLAEHPEDWQLCARLLPHVGILADLGDHTTGPLALSWILDRAGSYLRVRGEYRLAVPHLKRALAIREQVLGPEHLDVAASLNNLAVVLLRLDDLVAARPLNERALAIRERVLEPNHAAIAESVANLAVVVQHEGDLETARSLFERAVVIRERALGPDHIDTTESLNDLAVLLLEKGEPQAARRLHERVLAVRERVLGADHPRTAASLNNLAMVLRDLHEPAAARPLLERALAIKESVLGPDHPSTATSLNNLALVLRELGDLEAARPLSERVVAILERAVGPDHPHFAWSLRNLGLVLQGLGDNSAARLLFQRALDTVERIRGPEHEWAIELRQVLEEMATQ